MARIKQKSLAEKIKIEDSKSFQRNITKLHRNTNTERNKASIKKTTKIEMSDLTYE